jgi:hypothetical protein
LRQAFAEGWLAPGAGSGGESQRHVTAPRHTKTGPGSGTTSSSAPLSPSSLNGSSHHSVSSHASAAAGVATGPVLGTSTDYSGSVRLDRHHTATAVSVRLQHAKAGAHHERSSIAGSSGSGGSGSGSCITSSSSGVKPHTAVQIAAAPTAAVAAADNRAGGTSNGLKSNGSGASPNGRYSGQGSAALQTSQAKFTEVRAVQWCVMTQ